MTHTTAHQPFVTRQFMAGNSPAVRIPANMAFPPKTELVVVREGDRIIVEPKEKKLGDIPKLLHALNENFVGGRPEFDETERDWL
ncbi:MAG: AbrB/MazE/SpoVT family DNA-binding domain-containing protein [Deltaproteobacteria bacterium]|jgi:antitoxin VapB|nr:AbrB/MazE/SpoVT family DNA-binding domain-containing protein [Deltaproteobacteria bacterium]